MTSPAFYRILLGCALLPFHAFALTMDFVTVGNPGNAADPANSGSVPGIGTVNAAFGIGTYEVTNSQYAEFLNSVDVTGANALGLYDVNMGATAFGGILFNVNATIGSKFSIRTGFANMPVVYVSFFDAARFTNWLHNGQGSGATETGAYTLSGGTVTPGNAATVSRNSGAQFWVPSENEWYKAAYHQPVGLGGDSDNYWRYPMGTNLQPFSDETSCLGQLRGVLAVVGHQHWDTVSGEGDVRRFAPLGRQPSERVGDSVGCRLDEIGVIEEDSNLVDLRSGWPRRLPSGLDVFAVLSATGVRTVSR